jgi:hypothetical protein
MRVLGHDRIQVILGEVQDARDWVVRVEVLVRGDVISDLLDDCLT